MGNVDATQESTSNRPAHLFQPGNRANPGGRPKGSISLSRYLQNRWHEKPPEDREKFAIAIEQLALVNPAALKEYLNRVEGSVPVVHILQLADGRRYDEITESERLADFAASGGSPELLARVALEAEFREVEEDSDSGHCENLDVSDAEPPGT